MSDYGDGVYRAFGDIAASMGMAAAANTQAVTCGGCIGHDNHTSYCGELREGGLCQRQVFVRVTMARMIAELVRTLTEAHASEKFTREVIAAVHAVLVDAGGRLTQNRSKAWPNYTTTRNG